mgnify:CR=1 FL=1
MDSRVMYQISYGLYVLTAKEGGKDNGCIVNTVTQVTSSPNRITVAVNKQNYTHDMILRSGMFNVSVLAQSAPFDLFRNFGYQSGLTADKFQQVPFVRMNNGIARLSEHATACFSGRVVSATDLGTHTLFLADVTDGELLCDEEPVTYAYYQKNIKPAPAPTKKTGWRCRICGYIYEGETLPPDFVCPVCKHGAEDFEKL